MQKKKRESTMTVKEARLILEHYDENEQVYIVILGEQKKAVFQNIRFGDNGNAVQLSAFGEDNVDEIADLAVDLLRPKWPFHKRN
jgi:hypothetical protein